MFGVGALVAAGALALKPVLILSTVGAIGGDCLSFALGRHYRQRLKGYWPFSRYPALVEKGEHFFRRYGGKSVFLGRFVGPIRPILPVVAGMLGMKPLSFILIDILSGIGWAFVYVMPGVFFGTSLAVAGAVSARLAVLLGLLLAMAWFLVWISRKITFFLGNSGPRWLNLLEQWSRSETESGWIVMATRAFLRNIFQRQKGEELFLVSLVLLFLSGGIGFLWILHDILRPAPMMLADRAVYHFFQSLRTPWGDTALLAVSELNAPVMLGGMGLAILVILLIYHCYREALYWGAGICVSVALVLGINYLFTMVPHPVWELQDMPSYPLLSIYCAWTTMFYGALAVLLGRGLSAGMRRILFASVSLFILLTALSRLYLGAHCLSGVLAGILLGTCGTALWSIGYIEKPGGPLPRRLLAATITMVLCIGGSIYITAVQHNDRVRYLPHHHPAPLSFRQWISGDWRRLPAWRIDLAGEIRQPLVFQWCGPIKDLSDALSKAGWHRPEPVDVKALMQLLSPDTPLDKFPVLPRLHDGHVECLRLVLPRGNQRWVLRIWPTSIVLNTQPLFLGTVQVEAIRGIAGLFRMSHDTGDYTCSIPALDQALRTQFPVKEVYRSLRDITPYTRKLRWEGATLLAWQPSPALTGQLGNKGKRVVQIRKEGVQ